MKKLTLGTLAIGTVILALLLYVGIAYAQVVSTLAPGDSGPQVSELQTYLAQDASVYPEALVTGYYGSLTTAAVQRFQCAHGIVCDGSVSTTGFGRVGPITLATIQGTTASTPGIPNTGAIDQSAPIMAPAIVIVGRTQAVISWINSEPAENAVIYGSSWPFYLGTTQSVWSGTFGTTATVVISGLQPNHTYYYARQSVDAAGNVQYDIGKSFTTQQ